MKTNHLSCGHKEARFDRGERWWRIPAAC